ncbi:hypothetical protein [Natronoglycomyces albus]|uniref:Uncharacterized protein n=1 Tax=Natronoglycomyces albus TaxID=2811108 RepID=A0A895XTY3_9ACTN|nr:hypothetical protein [Natronoglycomyces albus]QSB05710.1 hypothetical protein JQS30_01925 [Natronoglycomyces albus]
MSLALLGIGFGMTILALYAWPWLRRHRAHREVVAIALGATILAIALAAVEP